MSCNANLSSWSRWTTPLHVAVVESARLPSSRSLPLPTLRFSMAELAEAIARVHAVPAPALVRWSREERID